MMITSLQSSSFTVKVDSLGAQLSSLALDGREYLWQGNPKWWPRRAPILFPIVGSLRGGQAVSEAGPCRMGRHGLARNLEHTVLRQSADSVLYELVSSAETLRQYPYPFRLQMCYRILKPGTLETRFSVTNTGTLPLPFAVGGHPAFQVPVGQASGEAFTDYSLHFSQEMTCSSPMLTGTDGLLDFSRRVPVLDHAAALPLRHSLFDHDALVLEKVPDRTVTLRGGKSGYGVRLDFADFAYLGIWSPAGEAPFVALEPWTGCSTATDEEDCLAHKRGMHLLPVGETAEYAFSITVF